MCLTGSSLVFICHLDPKNGPRYSDVSGRRKVWSCVGPLAPRRLKECVYCFDMSWVPRGPFVTVPTLLSGLQVRDATHGQIRP